MPENQNQSALEATSAAIKRGIETATDATKDAMETASDATQVAVDAMAQRANKMMNNADEE